jgi:hypothetical protein
LNVELVIFEKYFDDIVDTNVDIFSLVSELALALIAERDGGKPV